jgi:two-component system, NtrC family, sensor kinase
VRVSDEETIGRLERACAAKDKTIATLIARIEGEIDPSSAQFAFRRQVALERIIAAKTREIEEQRAALQVALSELRTAHTTLLQAHKLQAIGQLAAGVAHEINTPTQFVGDNLVFLRRAFASFGTIVRAYQRLCCALGAHEELAEDARTGSALLKKAKADFLLKEVPPAIEQALEGVARVANIVAAMKSFSHPSDGAFSKIDLNEAIQATVTVARNEYKYVADLELELDEGLPLVPCMRDEINQVVLNLVVNAAHAIQDANERTGREKGKIVVRTTVAGAGVVIDVRDDGAGIPEEVRPRIFEPFFTTKAVGRGTGQGLAIAHAVVVDKHHGAISFDSELGKGTTFHVCIPLEPASPEAARTET